MTTIEILRAPLLDILFDGRNKAYGAYTLRREYNRRLLGSLLAGIGLLVLLILLNAWKSKGHTAPSKPLNPDIQITTIVLPEEKKERPKPPEKKLSQPAPPKPAPAAAPISPTVLIVPDDKADKDRIPSAGETDGKLIFTATGTGTPYEGAGPGDPPSAEPAPAPVTPDFVPSHSNPEYPGGPAALKEFLSRNLFNPDDLETGEQKIVRIRFVVDKDGMVSVAGIETSGGAVFDKEVIRVCKKMPKWKPAMQNGHPISVSYILPVTFIGVEQ